MQPLFRTLVVPLLLVLRLRLLRELLGLWPLLLDWRLQGVPRTLSRGRCLALLPVSLLLFQAEMFPENSAMKVVILQVLPQLRLGPPLSTFV